MASRHDELSDAGARVVAISVDDPGKGAGMVRKLGLPFPVLSDPDGSKAIKPYDVWHDENHIARPAIVIVDRDGEEVFRQVSREFSDRLTEDELIERVRRLELPAVEQQPNPPGQPQPSDRAFPVEAMWPYFRGVKFASIAFATRMPAVEGEAKKLREEAERYIEAANQRLTS